MQQMARLVFIVLMIGSIVALSGCMESNTKKFNTDSPVRVEVGFLSNQITHSFYISLYDVHNNPTIADGVADISLFKGKFQDNDANAVNQFILSKTYGAKASEFEETKMSFRGINRTELAWVKELPNVFNPEIGDVYKISVAFQLNESKQTLGNMTYIVWG